MSSFRLVNLYESNAGNERSKFREKFPKEAAAILNKYESLISHKTKIADNVGRTPKGTEIFILKATETLGKDIFILEIVFELDGTHANWTKFSWEHHINTQPDNLDPAKTLEEIINSLRSKL